MVEFKIEYSELVNYETLIETQTPKEARKLFSEYINGKVNNLKEE